MFMFMKFVALLGITAIGIVVAITGFTWKGTPSEEWKTHGWFEGTSSNLSNWAVAIYAGLWAFDGWDNVRISILDANAIYQASPLLKKPFTIPTP